MEQNKINRYLLQTLNFTFFKIFTTTVSHLWSQANHLISAVISQDAYLSPGIFFYSCDDFWTKPAREKYERKGKDDSRCYAVTVLASLT